MSLSNTATLHISLAPHLGEIGAVQTSFMDKGITEMILKVVSVWVPVEDGRQGVSFVMG